MAEPRPVTPLLLIVAAFSRYPEVLAWAGEQIDSLFGTIGLVSLPFDFVQTRYYEASMGTGLKKCFFVCERLIEPNTMADAKLQTNLLELEAATNWRKPEPRPLNLDPGLLSLGKFMLATTKDQAHRIYLRDGIYAEVTLHFHAGEFVVWPWTYADYQLPCVREFLKCARDYYRQRLVIWNAAQQGESRP
jgi:Domain of unknown function (DUF4416)